MPRPEPHIDVRRPLPNPRHERVAQLLVGGKDGEPLSKADAYIAAGYDSGSRHSAFNACGQLLKRRVNGVQARVDYLTDQVATRLLKKRLAIDQRRLRKQDDRVDEVDEKLDWLWQKATEMRPKLTSQGNVICDDQGCPIMDPANFNAALKIAELLGIDAGRFVRQSRSGKIKDDYENLDDDALQAQLIAGLEQFGLTVTPIVHGEDLPKRTAQPTEDPNSSLN